MSEGNVIVLSIVNLGKFMRIFGLLLLFGVGMYLVYLDYLTSYTWVLPLSQNQYIYGYPKTSTVLAVSRLNTEWDMVTVYRGFNWLVEIPRTEGSVALVRAEGVNLLVILLIVVFVLTYAVLSRATSNKLLWTMILSFLLIAEIALIPYIQGGRFLGYEYTEKVLRINLDDLNWTSVGLLQVATLKDSAGDDPLLVSYYLPSDPAERLLYRLLFNASVPGMGRSYVSGEEGSSFYAVNSDILIYIVSTVKPVNKTLIYHRVEFKPSSNVPQLYVYLSIALYLLSITVYMTASKSLRAKKKEGSV